MALALFTEFHTASNECTRPGNEAKSIILVRMYFTITISKLLFDTCSAVLDFVPFIPLTNEVCLQRHLDGASKPIYITGGMPFGNSVQNTAYVRNKTTPNYCMLKGFVGAE